MAPVEYCATVTLYIINIHCRCTRLDGKFSYLIKNYTKIAMKISIFLLDTHHKL